MDAISPTFRLDSETDFRGISLFRDWVVNERERTVFYRPARLLFVVDYRPPADGRVTPLALSATLRHACTGHDMPPPSELRQLGKDALHAFLIASDIFEDWLPPTRPTTTPAQLQYDDDIPF